MYAPVCRAIASLGASTAMAHEWNFTEWDESARSFASPWLARGVRSERELTVMYQ